MSRLAWGVWVEIIILYAHFGLLSVTPRMRRVSWNVRYVRSFALSCLSRLAWGVWVEIIFSIPFFESSLSRLAWGVWVEMFKYIICCFHIWSHASHEACELKFGVNLDYVPANDVTPRMRRVSWNVYGLKIYLNYMSRLAWGVWVEIYNWWISGNRSRSHASHEACELKSFIWTSV